MTGARKSEAGGRPLGDGPPAALHHETAVAQPTFSSYTSNTSVAEGGMTGGYPRAP